MARVEGISPGLLEQRFAGVLEPLLAGSGSGPLLVAVSGGLDSVVLLHLLRATAGRQGMGLEVAHLDHAMRAESAGDLDWVRGLCAAWQLPLHTRRLTIAPRGEDRARMARYGFLHEVAESRGARAIATAHHADDQAETILFRILRGTGLRGLRGIPSRTRRGVIRPLLGFWRTELERYARAHNLRFRTDSTNRSLDPARNLLRLRVLPRVERSFAPAARRHLVALAHEAAEVEAALERQVADAEAAAVTRDGGAVLLARTPLLGYDSATATRLLRRSLRRFGTVPGRAGTRSALQFITDASSGRVLPLGNGVILRAEFDTVRIERVGDPDGEEPLEIPRPEPGTLFSAECSVGGMRYRVTAGLASRGRLVGEGDGGWSAALPVTAESFPLRVRSWEPGDRVRTSGGGKSLKKLFLEQRIPRSRRHRLPVVEDATGSIVWVAGIGRPLVSAPDSGAEALLLSITNA